MTSSAWSPAARERDHRRRAGEIETRSASNADMGPCWWACWDRTPTNFTMGVSITCSAHRLAPLSRWPSTRAQRPSSPHALCRAISTPPATYAATGPSTHVSAALPALPYHRLPRLAPSAIIRLDVRIATEHVLLQLPSFVRRARSSPRTLYTRCTICGDRPSRAGKPCRERPAPASALEQPPNQTRRPTRPHSRAPPPATRVATDLTTTTISATAPPGGKFCLPLLTFLWARSLP
jgi:hypothetical protein